MFENACGATPQLAYRRSPQSLLLSGLLHATVVLGLFAVHFSSAAPVVSASRQHITLIALIAPARSPPPTIRRPRLTPLTRAVARSFRTPPPLSAPALPKIALDLPPAPALDTPRLPLETPELTRIPAAPAPPLKTNNLVAAPREAALPAPKLAVQSAGFTGPERPAPNPPRGALSAGLGKATGFDSAAPGDPARPSPAVWKGGFTDASVAAAATPPRAARANAASVVTPVEILSKPRPLYAPEARRLKLEGEVLVELLFTASGEARVLRVVQGLGHGLDESAVVAAQAIRFRPAERGGAPIDSTALVHIIFQLAY